MILGLCLGAVSCNDDGSTEAPTEAPTETPTETPTEVPEEEGDYTLEMQKGYNQLTFYWVTSGSIANCDVCS